MSMTLMMIMRRRTEFVQDDVGVDVDDDDADDVNAFVYIFGLTQKGRVGGNPLNSRRRASC